MSSKGHLLVVDDEPAFRTLVRTLLVKQGYQVSEASGGPHALELLANGLKPDLILLDYRMPQMNGAQTLDALRSKNIYAPAVLVSAAAEIFDLAAKHGFDAAIPKPCSIESIVQIIEPLLSARVRTG